MVKAYLRYVQDDVLNSLVGKHSAIIHTTYKDGKELFLIF